MQVGNKVLLTFNRHNFEPSYIFDVGANVGQSTAEFSKFFPQARIFAFEPVSASFSRLQAATADRPNISCHRLVFSRATGETHFVSTGTSTGNRIANAKDKEKHPTEIVQMTTGEDFCRENGIKSIDYLKIDTEGHDLEVLVGFSLMLRSGTIDYVQVECGLSPDNERHVPYERLAHYLFAFGYRLHGLFDLMPQRKTTRRGAFFGNAVFVSSHLVSSSV